MERWLASGTQSRLEPSQSRTVATTKMPFWQVLASCNAVEGLSTALLSGLNGSGYTCTVDVVVVKRLRHDLVTADPWTVNQADGRVV
jgi:hypothetical protein